MEPLSNSKLFSALGNSPGGRELSVQVKVIGIQGPGKYLVDFKGSTFLAEINQKLQTNSLVTLRKTDLIPLDHLKLQNTLVSLPGTPDYSKFSNALIQSFLKAGLPLKPESLQQFQNHLQKDPTQEKIRSRLMAQLESKGMDPLLEVPLRRVFGLSLQGESKESGGFQFSSQTKTALDEFNRRTSPQGRWVLAPMVYQVEGKEVKGLGKFLFSNQEKILRWGFDVQDDPPWAFFFEPSKDLLQIKAYIPAPWADEKTKKSLRDQILSPELPWVLEFFPWEDYDGFGDDLPPTGMNWQRDLHV